MFQHVNEYLQIPFYPFVMNANASKSETSSKDLQHHKLIIRFREPCFQHENSFQRNFFDVARQKITRVLQVTPFHDFSECST